MKRCVSLCLGLLVGWGCAAQPRPDIRVDALQEQMAAAVPTRTFEAKTKVLEAVRWIPSKVSGGSDLNGDGRVDLADFALFQADFAPDQNVVAVHTFADLEAAQEIYNQDMTLYIWGTISVPRKAVGGYLYSAPGKTIRLIGAEPQARLDFSTYTNAWPGTDYNGLTFNCGNLIIKDIALTNYQAQGAVIKLPVDGHVWLENIHCENIGTFLTSQLPNNSRGYNTIFGHGPVASLTTRGNTFKNCCTSHEAWAHCYYVYGDYFDIDDRWYDGCGSVWALLGRLGTGSNATIKARVGWANGVANVWDRGSQTEPAKQIAPWLAAIRDGHGSYTVDRLLGEWSYLWNVGPTSFDSQRFTTSCNTSTAKVGPSVAVWLYSAGVSPGGYYTADQWRSAGFEK